MASTRLKNPATGASVQSERRTLTWSGWIKKIGQGADQDIYTGRYTGSYFAHLAFDSDDKIRIRQYAGGSSAFFLKTTRVFRDPNAWYHIVMAVDTTQATSSNRIKLYVNGEQLTTFDTETYPSQNLDTYWQMTGTDSYPSYLGWDGTYYFNGLMSDVYIIGGTAYPASTFGSTDATTGEWKPNANPTISYGTGVAGNAHLKFDDTSNFGKNSATGFTSNHWSVDNGTMTKTEDCPSNVFPTLNPLLTHAAHGYSLTIGLGNNKITFNEPSTWTYSTSTIAGINGKFYAEFKVDAVGSEASIGVIASDTVNVNQTSGGLDDYLGKETDSIGYFNDGRIYNNNSQGQTGLTSFTSGTIVGVAMDLDNNTVQFYNNGSTVGNTVSISADKFYHFGVSGYNSTQISCNFGNGYFGTTAVSSAGTNASGIGIFEFDVPTNYRALSTKGLNL